MIAFTQYSFDNRVRREAEALASLGDYRVLVLAVKEGSRPRHYHLDGVEVRELDVAKYQGESVKKYLISYLKFGLLVFSVCNKLLFHKSLDIVHIHNMPNIFIFCAIIPLLFGRRAILDIHDTMLETYLAKFDGRLNKLSFWALRLEEFISCAFAHKIICVNHVQREMLVKRGIPERKMTVLFNTPDPRIYHPGNGTAGDAGTRERFKIIYHGTVTKRLSLDLAIRAVANLVKKIPRVDFSIVGPGEDVDELTGLSQELGIKEFVHFEKPVRAEKVAEILSRMNLGIVPNARNISTDLMLPVKMLECIALGIPVVVPRLKAIQYYFSDDMVTYFEPGNVDSLANSILDAFNDEDKRIDKAENAKCFLQKYGWDIHKFTLIDLYKSILRGG